MLTKKKVLYRLNFLKESNIKFFDTIKTSLKFKKKPALYILLGFELSFQNFQTKSE